MADEWKPLDSLPDEARRRLTGRAKMTWEGNVGLGSVMVHWAPVAWVLTPKQMPHGTDAEVVDAG